MVHKPKVIKVHPYNPEWPKKFEVEANKIKKALGPHCSHVYHIGSTSIPQMTAKEDIDILLIVPHLKDSLELTKIGYTFKGELNIPLRYYFSKNTSESKVNLHVCEKDHGFIKLNLTFRDFLRSHPKFAKEYSDLKQNILKDESSGERIRWFLTNYSSKKDDFIKSTLNKAGYLDYTVNFCIHHNEWNEYHRIRKNEIFKDLPIKYDENHPCFTNENNFHFCLYKGSKVIGTAQVELLSDKKAALRPFCIDEPYKGKGAGSYFLKFIEKWLRYKGIEFVHLHANLNAIDFYKKHGYFFTPFDDPDGGLPSKSKDMGKKL